MATIKSFTDIEQSKKLTEILPLESADMYYFLDPTPAGNIYHIVTPQIDFGVKTREPEYNEGDIPCWSLAALLGILSFPDLFYNDGWNLYVTINDKIINVNYIDNPIDACYELILKLHERKML